MFKALLRLARVGRNARLRRARELLAAGRSEETAGRLAEARQRYASAAQIAPDHAPAHLNLGIALDALGEQVQARAAYEAALRADPLDAFVHYNLGNLLYRQGEYARAENLLREALRHRADFFEAQVVLSNILDAQGRWQEAAQSVEAALRLRPDSAGALLNYGVLLRKLERGDAALETLERALRHAADGPERVDVLEALSALQREQGFAEASILRLREALALAPERFDLESRELFALNFDETLPAEALFARHRDFGARLERKFPPLFDRFSGARDPARRLRLGYLSSDFRLHPVAQFARVPIERHDRSAFEVFCYSTSPDVDPVTEHLRACADRWFQAWGLSDAQLARRIHDDAIDILIDLSGHTGMFRLATFAHRPAPVQAAWLAYLNTTGLQRMHYRICDARTDPQPGADALHTERLVRMPHSQWCYRPYVEVEAAASAPCLRNGYITFGSFNSVTKITPAMCLRWSALLQALPDSRLLIGGMTSERKRDLVCREFVAAGIAASRLSFLPHIQLHEYASGVSTADIALDTFPYGGGTTTFDALWMGVPVLTATGGTPPSRSAASILSALGLDDWVAADANRYVGLALEKAGDPAALDALRRTLRTRLQASPLMDERQFTRDLEAAYRSMWRNWCATADE